MVRCLALLAVLTLLVSGCGVFSSNGPDKAAEAFLTAWSTGDVPAAAAETDDPKSAADLLAAIRTSLAPVADDSAAFSPCCARLFLSERKLPSSSTHVRRASIESRCTFNFAASRVAPVPASNSCGCARQPTAPPRPST